MKNLFNVFAAGTAVAALGLGAGAAQAADATATATAEILEQVTIAQAADLDFGTIVPSTTAASTVVIAANAAGTRTCGAGLTCAGTPGSGRFDVTGSNGQTVDITDNGSDIALSDGTNSMSVAFDFSSATLAMTGSAVPLYVGGTLDVAQNQPTGVYTGTIAVSANYQ
jgi:hypothetical protein